MGRAGVVAALAALLIAGAPRAPAQVGTGESAAGVLDALAPRVQIVFPDGYTILQGGVRTDLVWQLQELLPGIKGEHLARVLVDGAPADSTVPAWRVGSFTWRWIPPEISAGGCRLEVLAVDAMGNRTEKLSSPFTILPSWTGVETTPARGPLLAPPHPNPANPATIVAWDLPAPGRLRLTVHDLRGRRVATPLDGFRPAGPGSLRWEARDREGRRLPAGVYHLRLEHSGPDGVRTGTRRLVVLP